MGDPSTQVAQVAGELVAEWAERERGLTVSTGGSEPVDASLSLLSLSIDGRSLALAVVPLFPVQATADTLRRKAAIEERLAQVGAGSVVVWVPPGAEVPMDDGDAFVSRVAEAAAALGPGERGEVKFPVLLDLRRNDDNGTYLSAVGGLAPHWARFTNRVFGYYQLDSSAIHRLPEDPEKVTQLIEFIVLVANGIRTVGKSAEVKAEDTWIVQRLRSLPGPVLLAAAPDAAPDDGAIVRRALRTGVKLAASKLSTVQADTKALAFVGIYRSLAEENATIALRGMDPSVFAHFDFACLLADGRLKPLFGPKPGTALSA